MCVNVAGTWWQAQQRGSCTPGSVWTGESADRHRLWGGERADSRGTGRLPRQPGGDCQRNTRHRSGQIPLKHKSNKKRRHAGRGAARNFRGRNVSVYLQIQVFWWKPWCVMVWCPSSPGGRGAALYPGDLLPVSPHRGHHLLLLVSQQRPRVHCDLWGHTYKEQCHWFTTAPLNELYLNFTWSCFKSPQWTDELTQVQSVRTPAECQSGRACTQACYRLLLHGESRVKGQTVQTSSDVHHLPFI